MHQIHGAATPLGRDPFELRREFLLRGLRGIPQRFDTRPDVPQPVAPRRIASSVLLLHRGAPAESSRRPRSTNHVACVSYADDTSMSRAKFAARHRHC
jgi:hypothetical protein